MKSGPVRATDALDFLRLALAEQPKSQRRQLYLDAALWTYWAAWRNVREFGAFGDRRGRPKGTKARQRYDDNAALELMTRIAIETGETKARKLAKHAVESGKVPPNGAQVESVIRRLVKRWAVIPRTCK